jgi:hypothetical protein
MRHGSTTIGREAVQEHQFRSILAPGLTIENVKAASLDILG